jgi:hypothetical protein
MRYCGALTQVTGQSSVFANGKLVAVENDKDSHNDGGGLISATEGSIFIEGKKMIVAMADKASPDSIGMMLHPFSPTDPAKGSNDVFAYGGKAGGGIGNILGGKLKIGELVKVGSQLMGTVKNSTGGSSGSGSVILQNMPSGSTPQAGDTLVGQDSGNSLTLTSFTRSDAYDGEDTAPDYTGIMTYAITDDYGVIALPQYFTGKPSQDYDDTYIIVDNI